MNNEEYDKILADLEARRVALIPEIKAAFADVPYPGDDGIDEHGCPWDEGVSDYFKGKGQVSHKADDLRIHRAGIDYMLPAALHYFLPAYAIAQLEDPAAADTIGDSLVHNLSVPQGRPIRERLSSAQRQALIKFVEYLGDTYDYDIETVICAIELLKTEK